MGKRLALIFLVSTPLLSFCVQAQPSKDNAHSLAQDNLVQDNKEHGISSSLLLDPRFSKMIEIAAQPKENVLQNAKNKLHKKQEHPVMKERMLKRMQSFRSELRSEALQASKDMGLKLTPQQEDEFIRSYWQKRAEIEKTLYQEIEPRRNELNQKAKEDLKTQFSKN